MTDGKLKGKDFFEVKGVHDQVHSIKIVQTGPNTVE